nr:hypothetical protein Iba_chr10eCG13250 [Ipomoea batatas]
MLNAKLHPSCALPFAIKNKPLSAVCSLISSELVSLPDASTCSANHQSGISVVVSSDSSSSAGWLPASSSIGLPGLSGFSTSCSSSEHFSSDISSCGFPSEEEDISCSSDTGASWGVPDPPEDLPFLSPDLHNSNMKKIWYVISEIHLAVETCESLNRARWSHLKLRALVKSEMRHHASLVSTSWSKSETFRFLFAEGVEFLRMHEFNNLSSETVSSSNDLSSEAELRSSSLSVEFETLALSFLLGFPFFDAGDGLRA